MIRFTNKTVLITGASRGLGRSTAVLFASEGANIVVNYNDSSAHANSTVKELTKLGVDAIAVKADISKEDEVINLINKTVNTFGKIDVLVNNAGIAIDSPALKRTTDQWNKVIGVDLLGTFLCIKYAAPYMIKQKKGVIVNVSSTSGVYDYNPMIFDYDVAKAGVIVLTKDFARELSPNIRVNAIAPGWINTDMIADLAKAELTKAKKEILLGRFAEPEEIAKIILFLSSDDSSYINGSVLIADGGIA